MAEEQSDQSEKTEEATPQRREEFRKQGQVAQSREVSTVLILFGGMLFMWSLGSYLMYEVRELFEILVGENLAIAVRSGDVSEPIKFAFKKAVFLSVPFLAFVALIGYSSSLLQIGFLIKEKGIEPKIDHLDPIKGLKRLFSLKNLVEGIKATLKVTVIFLIAGLILRSELLNSPFLVYFSIEQIFGYFGSVSLKLVGGISIFMLILAVADYGFQRWDLEKKMMMTKQEVKDELKNREGDPLVKSRIRRLQRETAQKRMMEAIPKADVIITNPTHIAVALQYSGDVPAPKIVAKGAGIIAEKIKEIARNNEIPIVENKPLARAIYKTLEIGQLIPRELYNAVAEVLAYVYRLKKKVVK